MREKILKLRKKRLTYRKIAEIVGCNVKTVAYHCNPATRLMCLANTKKIVEEKIDALKSLGGRKCCICEYDRCLRSLHFHHVDPTTKEHRIGEMVRNRGKGAMNEEIEKCLMLCSNCHGELHEGLILVLVDGKEISIPQHY